MKHMQCLVRARPLVTGQYRPAWLAAWLSVQDQTSERKWDATRGVDPRRIYLCPTCGDLPAPDR
jgi:hypothetical protein